MDEKHHKTHRVGQEELTFVELPIGKTQNKHIYTCVENIANLRI